MKNIKGHLFIIVLFVLSTIESFGQDPIFSQYYANPLYLNPALAGSTLSPRAIVNYRNQWPSLAANFVTYNVSYEHYVNDINSTFALLANNDRTAGGAFNATSISLIYTYNLQASRDLFVNLSVQGSVSNRSLHWEDLYFEDAIHPVYGLNYYSSSEIPPDKTSIWFPDFSFGAVVGYKDLLYGGIAIHHLAQPKDGLYNRDDSKVYRKYTAHLGANFNLSGKQSSWNSKRSSILSPALLYQQQLNFKTLSAGLYYTYNPIMVGAWYRCNIANPDAVVLMVGLNFNGFQVGYSYDITLSK
ncbi:MAG: PorP/SprF family type IX secretion system membrane protein [Bacteroidales bacterium]|nr:PorP/SprF family type IX secretion system membrane protein [Bacteroidales bacterium]